MAKTGPHFEKEQMVPVVAPLATAFEVKPLECQLDRRMQTCLLHPNYRQDPSTLLDAHKILGFFSPSIKGRLHYFSQHIHYLYLSVPFCTKVAT